MTPGFAKSRKQLPQLYYPEQDRVIIDNTLFPAPGGGGFAEIVKGEFALASGGGTSTSLDTTGADLIVVAVTKYAAGGATTFSDNQGNTYTALTSQAGSTSFMQLYYCAAPTVGSGHTWTCSATSSFPTIFVFAFSGAHASPFDDEIGASASGTSVSTGSKTPSVNGSLIFSAVGIYNTFGSLAVDASLTIGNENSRTGAAGGGAATLIQATAAAINPGWSWTTTRQASAVLAIFKPA